MRLSDLPSKVAGKGPRQRIFDDAQEDQILAAVEQKLGTEGEICFYTKLSPRGLWTIVARARKRREAREAR